MARAYRRSLLPALLGLSLLAAIAPPVLGLESEPSLRLSATYDVTATIDYANGTMTVATLATVTNPSRPAAHSLTFNAAAFRLGKATISEVSVNGAAASWARDDQSLGVFLPAPLRKGQAAEVRIVYSARFLTTATDKNWLFAKLRGTLQGYRWIPWLSRELRFDRPNVGEPFVTSISPRVRVTFVAERPLAYVTSGARVSASGNRRTYVAHDVRDFNFLARPSFSWLKGKAAGVKILVAYSSLNGSTMMTWAKRSVQTYTNLIGAYPYGTLRIAESGGGNAMESPAMAWIPRGSSSVPWLVAHEVGHQWFYAVVGNDQAVEPFADEALVTLLTREATGRYVGSSCRQRPLDRTIYEYRQCYYGVIYVQGGDYLSAYRQRVGRDAFWRGVRSYYKQYAFGMGGSRALLDALDAAAGGLGGGHATRFPRLYAVE